MGTSGVGRRRPAGRRRFLWAFAGLAAVIVAWATAAAAGVRPAVSPAAVQRTEPSPPASSNESFAGSTHRVLDTTGTAAGSVSPSVPDGTSEELTAAVGPGPFVPPPSLVAVRMTSHALSSTLSGHLAGLRVLDARGSLVGWRLFLTPQACTIGTSWGRSGTLRRFHVVPEAPTVIDGDPVDLDIGRPRTVSAGHAVVVLTAAAGHGGGTFIARATFSMLSPSRVGAGASCTFVVSVAPTAP
jgi:hypothetical protein